MKYKVAIIGAGGYTGRELLYILQFHPYIEVSHVTSNVYKGKSVKDVFQDILIDTAFSSHDDKIPDDIEVVFMSTPDKVSMDLAGELISKGKKVIDLSGAFRLKNVDEFEKYYKIKHTQKDLLKDAVYGFPELYSDDIKKASLVANPGCYATSILLALIPFVKNFSTDDTIIIDAKSGLSGRGGRKEDDNTAFTIYNEDFSLYSPFFHKHIPEIKAIVYSGTKKSIDIIFTPHLIPMDRGIFSTIYIKLNQSINIKELKQIYRDFYKSFTHNIIIDGDISPHTKWTYRNNKAYINMWIRDNNIIIASVIDNLQRGAASQAISNLNLILGLDIYTGLI